MNPPTYDVVIVGARCAGSALALMLSRAGHKVMMVDRAVFPSDTMSGHFIHPAGVSFLRRWGLLDRLAATDTPPQTRMTVDFGPFALSGKPTPAPDGTDTGYGPRRRLIDTMLAGAAVEAGVEFLDGVTVRNPIFADGQVVGIEGVTLSGQPIEALARLVVGADGKRSRIAAAVGAAKYHERPATACSYYAYWSGFDAPHTHLFVRDGRFFVVLPTNDGLTLIAATWPLAEFDRVRPNLEGAFNEAVGEVPWIADRIASAKRVERFLGTADMNGFFRTAQGPGWALVGDAGYHRDPITAQGMTDAFLHAELLAGAIGTGLSGKMPMAAALAGYQRMRDATTMPMYELTCDLARLAPPTPEMAALLGALAYDRPGTERFLGVISGTVPVQDFFAPENIGAILGHRQAA
jgi:2-polyprenyl-6-methoxyphenol hydroxylase-like FAD-dependent oxidoreductase